jgi:glycosyltransferase involved in cell wall biosynthesis
VHNTKNFLILTPCFNAGKYLAATMESVLIQSTPGINITYMVCDGGSSDNSVSLLESYRSRFLLSGINFSYFSKTDTGMYDALAEGFRRNEKTEYDVIAYINAGDRYAPRSFSNVSKTFSNKNDWVTGISIFYNPTGDIVGARLPGPYPRHLISVGIFGLFLPCIQQESTFWSGRAHKVIDLDVLSSYKLAGDYYIWKCLAEKYQLRTVSYWLSGFTFQPGQLSEVRRDEYFNELRSIANKRSFWDYLFGFFVGLVWLLPDKWKSARFRSDYLDNSRD